jgi:hypothetical protein
MTADNITLNVSGTAEPDALARFLKWIAADIEIRQETSRLEKPLEYRFYPDSTRVETIEKLGKG